MYLDDDDKYDAYGSPNSLNKSTFASDPQYQSTAITQKRLHSGSTSTSSSPISNILSPEVSLKIGDEFSISDRRCISEKQRQKIAILNECRIFGDSIGYQLFMVQDPDLRSLTQFKIQELIYKAKVGTLSE